MVLFSTLCTLRRVANSPFDHQYRATDIIIPEAGKLELVYTPDDKSKKATALEVFQFTSPGMGLAMYNTQQVSFGMPRLGWVELAMRWSKS